jgi:class 3 adenylate cyclase/tetratricopeptide (TPR) repeat protein
MICASCQRQNPDDARFCDGCGGPLSRHCEGCGQELRADSRFCNGCGRPAQTPAGATAAAGPERSPRDYTPQHLAERILRSKSALEGERKQVTVLFADVKGSMELSDQVDPEAWHGILDRFFQILADGVHRFEGTVNQYTGDGIMAIFGAPLAHEDHTQRACWAALHLCGRLRAYSDELRLESGLDFSTRMGIHSGEVVVGRIGDDLRMDYTAQGQVVGLADRMQKLAGADRICLSEESQKRVAGYFQLRDLGESRVAGVAEPVRVFELEGTGALRTRLDVSRARGFSKFVGRDQEMSRLEAALEEASCGNGQVLGLVAEAGAGKSRLCFEFLERCRARGIPVRRAQGVAHGRAVPYLPVLQYLRESFGIAEGDGERTVRQKIAGAVAQLDRELLDALPILFDFLGVTDPDGAPLEYAGPELQRRQLGLLKRLTLARSERETAVLVFEDLHWFDPGSERFVRGLIDTVGGSRTLLIANYRPEYRGDWMAHSYAQQLALSPLGPDATRELLDDLLGEDPSLVGLAPRIHERTAGNPFFIEEIVQTLIESGAVEGEHRRYVLTRETASLEIPDSVHAVLAARIDRLSEEPKCLLQTAAVIGREFGASLLGRVAEISVDALAEAMRPLIEAEFLHETALYPEPEYAFKHPLTQEVAYRSQLRDRRAAVHTRVARGLEALHPDQLDERAALIAHHWEQAGESLEAARWHSRAAQWRGDNAPAETRAQWSRVRALLGADVESEEEAALALQARTHLLWQGARMQMDEQDAAALLEEGEALASHCGSSVEAIEFHGLGALALGFYGWGDEACRLSERAVELADEAGVPLARGLARASLAQSLSMRGRLREARAATDEGLKLAPEEPHLYFARGASLMWQGHLCEAIANFEHTTALAHASGAGIWEAASHSNCVTCMEMLGEVEGALHHARRAVEIEDRIGSLEGLIMAYGALARAFILAWQWEQAEAALAHPSIVGGNNRSFFHLMALELRARLALRRGEPAAARELLERGLTMRQHRNDGAWLSLRITHAHALIALGEPQGAAVALNQVERDIDESGTEGLRPTLCLARATWCEHQGDQAGRALHLRATWRAYEAMGANGQLARMQRDYAGLVPEPSELG